jgi:hypothetical protein
VRSLCYRKVTAVLMKRLREQNVRCKGRQHILNLFNTSIEKNTYCILGMTLFELWGEGGGRERCVI